MELRIHSCFWTSCVITLQLLIFLTLPEPSTLREASISLYYGKDTLYPDYKGQIREDSNKLTPQQNGKLKERFKDMLGFTRAPSIDNKPATRGQQEVPKYMRRLYDKNRNSLIHNGKVSANTVTSITGKIGRSMFFFFLFFFIKDKGLHL